jgi:hypothetical protein
MADIKWSAFPSGGAIQSGDQLVGLRAGANVRLTAPLFGSQVVPVTAATQAMSTNVIYIANRGTLVTFTLPTVAAVGDFLSIVGEGAGGWLLNMGTGQQVRVGNLTTTVTTGSVASTAASDALYLICITANTLWTTFCGPQGNLTIV